MAICVAPHYFRTLIGRQGLTESSGNIDETGLEALGSSAHSPMNDENVYFDQPLPDRVHTRPLGRVKLADRSRVNRGESIRRFPGTGIVADMTDSGLTWAKSPATDSVS